MFARLTYCLTRLVYLRAEINQLAKQKYSKSRGNYDEIRRGKLFLYESQLLTELARIFEQPGRYLRSFELRSIDHADKINDRQRNCRPTSYVVRLVHPFAFHFSWDWIQEMLVKYR